MSAKSAAEALLDLDVDLYQFSKSLPSGYAPDKREKVVEFISDWLLGTWTLTLAARSGNATEEQVIGALLYLEPLRFGSTCVCRGEAKKLFA